MHLLAATALVLLHAAAVCNALPGTNKVVTAAGLDDDLDLPGSPDSADSWKIGSGGRPRIHVPSQAQQGSGSIIAKPSFRQGDEYVVNWHVTGGKSSPASSVLEAAKFLHNTRINLFARPGSTLSLFSNQQRPALTARYPDPVFTWPHTQGPVDSTAGQFSMRVPDVILAKHAKAFFTYGDIDFVIAALQRALDQQSLHEATAVRPMAFTLHHARSRSAMAEGVIRWPATAGANR